MEELVMEEVVEKQASNIQTEMCFVGALYANPDDFVSYGNFMRSQYDFSDPCTKFFYDSFALMYTTFSQIMNETQVTIFMSQDPDRLQTYKKYKGWKTISQWIRFSEADNINNYFDIIKKYSLVREYERNGYPVQRMLSHPKFNSWKAQDIYRLIRSKADKINTVINASEESVVLNNGTEDQLKTFLFKPDMGLPMPWALMTKMFRGMRLGKMSMCCFLSNSGKTRNLVLLAAYVVFVQKKSFLLLSNEMDELDLRNCLITTVLNNPCFQNLHGIKRHKTEGEIVLGIYHDDSGNEISRYEDDFGDFLETEEEYITRLEQTSTEYNEVMYVSRWIDNHKEGKLFFKDVGSDYSDETLEFEFRKAKMIYQVQYCGYDTLKGYRTDDWSTIKQTVTKLKELMKELQMFCWSVYQLVDMAVFTDVFQLSSNDLAGSKQAKHVVDSLMIGKKIEKDEYHKYQYISTDHDWGEPRPLDLDLSKSYFAIKIDKNRGGNKNYMPLFDFNLDLNVWNEIGYIVKKGSVT